MSDIFISYSREDTAFVRQIHNRLSQLDREVWVDWDSIPITADWWHEICRGIESTNTFVFVISPASLASPVCNLEIAHALTHNKRLVPLVLQQADSDNALAEMETLNPDDNTRLILDNRDLLTIARRNHLSLKRHNWLFFDKPDDFEANFQRLLTAIDTDLDHVRQHTRILLRAREWQSQNHNPGFLLSGAELRDAEQWLSSTAGKSPEPAQLHINYILSSQRTDNRRRRLLFTIFAIITGLSIGLAIFSFRLYGTAIEALHLSNATEHALETQFANTQSFLETELSHVIATLEAHGDH